MKGLLHVTNWTLLAEKKNHLSFGEENKLLAGFLPSPPSPGKDAQKRLSYKTKRSADIIWLVGNLHFSLALLFLVPFLNCITAR